MEQSDSPLVILLFIGLAIVFRLIAGSLDTGRIEDYLSQRGARLISKSWEPFGPGWFGEKNARIYQIQFTAKDRSVRSAYAKTSMSSGVYLTQEYEVKAAPRSKATSKQLPSNRVARKPRVDLAVENARLRERIRQLKNREPIA